jgi:UDP-N-acetylglucosamine 2-epimerase (non-hydrolysing)
MRRLPPDRASAHQLAEALATHRDERRMRVVVIGGARPNFMKVAPILWTMRHRADACLVHTGQHYDRRMSDAFFAELDIPAPDINLGVGSGSHAEQTGRVMLAFEPWLLANPCDAVVVVGDVNSTLACSLVAAKLGIPVAHVEAGLRSFDRTMPEETNRVLTDALSSWLLTPSPDADENLAREGIDPGRVFQVGNVMVDTLLSNLDRAMESDVLHRLGVFGDYGLVTLHRPALVDDAGRLGQVVGALLHVAEDLPLLFPAHPRTRAALSALGVEDAKGIRLIEPQGYLGFLKLQAAAQLVLTDSGGVQEETTVLGVPCVTLRENTERPITILEGTNRLVGLDPDRIVRGAEEALAAPRPSRRPALWDGKAAERIVQVLTTGNVPELAPRPAAGAPATSGQR